MKMMYRIDSKLVIVKAESLIFSHNSFTQSIQKYPTKFKMDLNATFSQVEGSYYDIENTEFNPDTNPALDFGNLSAISIDTKVVESEKEKNPKVELNFSNISEISMDGRLGNFLRRNKRKHSEIEEEEASEDRNDKIIVITPAPSTPKENEKHDHNCCINSMPAPKKQKLNVNIGLFDDKPRRKSYNLHEKKEALKKLAANDGNLYKTAKDLQIARQTLHLWKKSQDAIYAANESKDVNTKKSRRIPQAADDKMKRAKFFDMEQDLVKWIEKQRENGLPVSQDEIKMTALKMWDDKYSALFPGSTFKASIGWVFRFMKRNGFTDRQATSIGFMSIKSKKSDKLPGRSPPILLRMNNNQVSKMNISFSSNCELIYEEDKIKFSEFDYLSKQIHVKQENKGEIEVENIEEYSKMEYGHMEVKMEDFNEFIKQEIDFFDIKEEQKV